jgi:hypothetical protein
MVPNLPNLASDDAGSLTISYERIRTTVHPRKLSPIAEAWGRRLTTTIEFGNVTEGHGEEVPDRRASASRARL